MMLPNGATVAVADGEKLSLFKNGGHESGVSLSAIPTPDLDRPQQLRPQHQSPPSSRLLWNYWLSAC